MKILGISGSLRAQSFNKHLLRAAVGLAPADCKIEIFDLTPIPLYNEDVNQQGFPLSVEDFRSRIRTCDGLLIVTPEYNYSIPGVLKNAIDWASRPPDQPFEAKPIAIMGASPSMFGSGRSQYHLRQVFIYLNGMILNRPELMVADVENKFDNKGELTDARTREQVTAMLASFKEWILAIAAAHSTLVNAKRAS